MISWISTIINEMASGNFSFAILLVGVAQLAVMLLNIRRRHTKEPDDGGKPIRNPFRQARTCLRPEAEEIELSFEEEFQNEKRTTG